MESVMKISLDDVYRFVGDDTQKRTIKVDTKSISGALKVAGEFQENVDASDPNIWRLIEVLKIQFWRNPRANLVIFTIVISTPESRNDKNTIEVPSRVVEEYTIEALTCADAAKPGEVAKSLLIKTLQTISEARTKLACLARQYELGGSKRPDLTGVRISPGGRRTKG